MSWLGKIKENTFDKTEPNTVRPIVVGLVIAALISMPALLFTLGFIGVLIVIAEGVFIAVCWLITKSSKSWKQASEQRALARAAREREEQAAKEKAEEEARIAALPPEPTVHELIAKATEEFKNDIAAIDAMPIEEREKKPIRAQRERAYKSLVTSLLGIGPERSPKASGTPHGGKS